MRILALDGSSEKMSIAVTRGDNLEAKRTVKSNRRLSEKLVSHIDYVLGKAGCELAQLDGIAVGIGPGSFTGLRVCLATLKACALGAQIPLVGIASLEVIAYNVYDVECRYVCVLSDARREMVYWALFKKTPDGLLRIGKYRLSDIDTLCGKLKTGTVLVGDGLARYTDSITQKCPLVFDKKPQGIVFCQRKPLWYPKAEVLAGLARKRFAEKDTDDPLTLVPLYLYPDDCQVVRTKKKKK